MALDSRQKRAAVIGVGRVWYRNSHPSSIDSSQRASIGQVYPVSSFQSVTAPIFTGTIPDISETENTGNYNFALGSYFTGATSYSISPTIETGWTFSTTTGELIIDTNDTDSFGPFIVTGTNLGGFSASNAFDIDVISNWVTVPQTANIWQVQNPVSTTWDLTATNWDLSGNVNITVWDGIDEVWVDVTTTSVIYSDPKLGLGWDGGALYWDLDGNVYNARWS